MKPKIQIMLKTVPATRYNWNHVWKILLGHEKNL